MSSAPVFSLVYNTLLKLYNYSSHTQLQPSNNSKMSHLFIPDIFVWSSVFGAEQNMFKTSDFRDTDSIHFSRIPCRSRSLFFWGGGGGAPAIWVNQCGKWGRREWWEEGKNAIHDLAGFPLSLLFFPITPRSCSALVPIILSLRISLVSNTPR